MAANHPTPFAKLILVPLQHGEALYVDPETTAELTGERHRWVRLNDGCVAIYDGSQQDVRGVVAMHGKPI
jgi:hypothetical protein